ncbi:hypothetical protein XthCFBP4691_07710 [Xanthomonas theicola]|uniref:Replication protein n=1 Tax=Xanthomonas theicola TaxID=56464 RepID=A0A2S6ZGQ6_9XANT|nr:hypothetical protein [Xanthomonas theicola]PPT91434.1 hypothetical protein XthCFBP4691_07710 [Xanthomonas theicola]QNH27237.1 hypothetical protein G4Q83_22340 [Xanthomonas theicola]
MAPSPTPHRHVRWHTPANGKRRPGVLAATRDALVRGLEERQGSLWLLIRRGVIVAGYTLTRALHRIRSLRSDGAESLLAMAVALLYLADVRTGFIGRPRAGGGPWHRYTLADLAQLAYGAQTPAELRRAQRAIDMMISLGWAWPSKQVRRYDEAKDGFRSEPGVRRLNLDRLCKMTGTTWLLKRDREHADRKKGDGTAALQSAHKRRQEQSAMPVGRGGGERYRHDRARSTGDPPRSAGMLAITDILKG